ncbi:hypothetical protein HPB49_024604 [Dermacentor silvarum]|uniref:Uncharacterized protein n=1 Tax=Dermacentor silvarum TaxID=543639 RepID=A0ACB8CNE5_DERSI|nr:uncharacterized protein LOC125946388 [Dermacentor silvarum]KAH7946417.1 hypothetical protein HPB49_024604 [Dermacentor silvarum]
MHIRLGPYEEATVLQEQLDTFDRIEIVHELELTNCVVADPDDLCRCIIRCTQLRKLCCLSCGIRASDLVRFILPKLAHLSHLECTLDESADNDEAWRVRDAVQHSVGFARTLHHLYIEVADLLRFRVLTDIMKICPSVIDLHVHILRGELSAAVARMESLWCHIRRTECYKITSEVPPRVQREPYTERPLEDLHFRDCANVCGNLLFRRHPPYRNCTRLRDLAVCTEPLHPTDPVIVVINNDDTTPVQMQIRDAGLRNRWCDVRSLCLVLVGEDVPHMEFARAGGDFHSGLVTFFGYFKSGPGGINHLKELNMSSFHFEDETDFTQVLSEAGLTTLTALCVTPCGIWHEGALERLATTCIELDDLDVRAYNDSRMCLRCWQPLDLSPAAAIQLSLNRGRLTFCNVVDFASLDFLRYCPRISELRMAGMCRDPMTRIKILADKLDQNVLLRCLVLSFDGMLFDEDMCESLEKLECLRFLCLQTAIRHDISAVRSFIERVTSDHPLTLEIVHLHFTDNEMGYPQRYTWVRGPESVEQLRLGDEAPSPDPQEQQGRVFTDRPCVICSTAAFIGLVKPHNRGSRTQV